MTPSGPAGGEGGVREAGRLLLRMANQREADAPQEWLDHACGECVGWDADRGAGAALCGRHAMMAALEDARPVPAGTAEAKHEGAMEEAAKHADCCVDREERDRLAERLRQQDEEVTRLRHANEHWHERVTALQAGARGEETS